MMRSETKDILYMVLDFLDSFTRTSANAPAFVRIDHQVLKEAKDEIFAVLSQPVRPRSMGKKAELIGILPSVLLDKTKFRTNLEIVRLAEESLDVRVVDATRRSRSQIIGVIVTELAKRDERDLDLFLSAWRKFIEGPMLLRPALFVGN